jgi:diguanylate cyclase (GGDEF)-like protein/PAS domain S-box-containing protein
VLTRAELEAELNRSNERLAEAEALARVGSWEWDIPANRVLWSDQLFRIYGLEPGAIEPSYEGFLHHVHPDDRASVDERNHKAFADHQPFEDVKRVVRADGTEILMRTQGEVAVGDDGQPLRMIGVCEDVTDRVRAEEARRLVATIVDASSDAIVALDLNGEVTSWSRGAETLLGHGTQTMVGRHISTIVPPKRRDRELGIIARALDGDAVEPYETELLSATDETVAVSVSLSAMSGPNGQVEGLAWIARDVTERRRFEATVAALSDQDPLTGLLNRRRFTDLVREAGRRGARGAVIVIDVDGFADVNDALGHQGADEVLRSLARLVASHAVADPAGRLGSDELAILLEGRGPEQARAVAEELLASVRHQRFIQAGQPVRLTVSVGVAPFDVAKPAHEALAAADLALHDAKESGRDRVVVQRDAPSQLKVRGGWTRRLRAALDGNGLELHSQPILDLRLNTISQHELLLRLRDGDDLIAPGDFLGYAERSGLIHAIDRWVVLRAIELLASDGRMAPDHVIEVNLSASSVGDRELTRVIAREIDAAGIDPRRLVFEITETAAIANLEDARRFADRLTGLGCRFALDDFGTGFGSFTYLKHFPADYLKIDGEFVRSPRSRADQVIIRAIVDVAQAMGKRTIAESVTDAATIDELIEMGVDFAQGYHVGRPAPVALLSASGVGGLLGGEQTLLDEGQSLVPEAGVG